MQYKTEQETFWAGDFGNEYINRNSSANLLASNLNFFAKALNVAGNINSVLEFGCNIGMNLKALKFLYPNQSQYGIEINKKAVGHLSQVLDKDKIFNSSIFDFNADLKVDLTLIKGVLIHVDPCMLGEVYKKLVKYSTKYILVCEYYNPTPTQIDYRGHKNKLFKRDFCGEMLDSFSELSLVDYGFAYKRDPAFSQDDISWFLIRKNDK